MELIEKALELSPDNFSYLHTKGWGLYKQVKYQEALELIEKSWDSTPYKMDSMSIYFHLQEAKKSCSQSKEFFFVPAKEKRGKIFPTIVLCLYE